MRRDTPEHKYNKQMLLCQVQVQAFYVVCNFFHYVVSFELSMHATVEVNVFDIQHTPDKK